MDQYLNSRQYEILDELLANPAETGSFYGYNLQQLVDAYPQSGILRALLAHAGTNKDVQRAAVYYTPALLHKLVHEPDSLVPVNSSQVVNLVDAVPVIDKTIIPAENYFNIGPAVESHHDELPPIPQDVQLDTPPENARETNSFSFTGVNNQVPETLIDELTTETNTTSVNFEPNGEIIEAGHTIDDEVYDEIVGIENIVIPSFNTAQPAANIAEGDIEIAQAEVSDNETDINRNDIAGTGIDKGGKTSNNIKYTGNEENDVTEKWIIGNIASTDYFLFDNSVVDTRTEDKAVPQEPTPRPAEFEAAEQHEAVSKYNDEKMPYTFMWWLDKTRKEYASTYQPYNIEAIDPVKAPAISNNQTADALQHQYYENIFHSQSLEELEKTPQPDVPEIKRKEDVIIEKFIKEEPQIRPPSIEKLDNENKAKKSSEDRNDLVSETLAQIYIDQMLYHKAIATYKKMMLKFPEKSRYFASQIEQLEKKTN